MKRAKLNDSFTGHLSERVRDLSINENKAVEKLQQESKQLFEFTPNQKLSQPQQSQNLIDYQHSDNIAPNVNSYAAFMSPPSSFNNEETTDTQNTVNANATLQQKGGFGMMNSGAGMTLA